MLFENAKIRFFFLIVESKNYSCWFGRFSFGGFVVAGLRGKGSKG
jgi:hypothetical protein